MRKFLIALLTIIMMVSLSLFIACGKTDSGNGGNENSQNSSVINPPISNSSDTSSDSGNNDDQPTDELLTVAQVKSAIDNSPNGVEVEFEGVVVGFDSMGYAHVGDSTGIIYVRAKHAKLTKGAHVKVKGTGFVYKGTSASYPEYTRQIKDTGIIVEDASGSKPTVKPAVTLTAQNLLTTSESADKSKSFHGNLVTLTGTVSVGDSKFAYYLLDDEGNRMVGLHHYSLHFANSLDDSVNKFNALNGKKITIEGVIYRYYTAENIWTFQYIYEELGYVVVDSGEKPCEHSWQDATCTTPKTCSTCGATEGKAIGHSWVNATCSAPKTCSTCGETEGNALGHNFIEGSCSVCGAKDDESHTHTWQNATCTTPKTCSGCGATEGNALGHAYGDYTYDLAKHTLSCSKCGSSQQREHNFVNGECEVCEMSNLITLAQFNEYANTFAHNTTSALKYRITGVVTSIASAEWGNCYIKDESGEIVYVYGLYSADGSVRYDAMSVKPAVGDTVTLLTVCGNYNGPQAKDAWLIELSSHTHTWQNATCTTPKTCSTCGATEGKANGHSWKNATCTTPKTCSTCGATEGKANGHSWEDATCTLPKTCSTCGETEGSANGHSWKNATCTLPKTCSTCGATEGSANGHSWVDATCTLPKTCSTCGEIEGEALGHSYGSATYNLECHEVTCSKCGEVVESEHTFENGECGECGMSDSLTLAQFNEYGVTFASDKYSSLKYRISGSIVHVDLSKSTFYIKDESGDIASIAGIEYKEGIYTKVGITEEIVVGNTITLLTKCGNKSGSPSGTRAKIVTYTHKLVDDYVRYEDYIYFGYYPQLKVTNEDLIATLNQMAGTLPTVEESADWIDYGYRRSKNNYGAIYIIDEPFMWYKDVKVGIDTYRAVYFIQYRHLQNNVGLNSSNQGSNGYYSQTVYWFKFDLIRWNILEDRSDKVLLISELILDSQYFYKSSALRSEDVAIWPNNYERSDLREWLNNNFYNSAFSTSQRGSILLSAVDNSLASTGDTSNDFVCNNTQDKVFLLSRVEAEAYIEAGANFIKSASQYSLAQGFSLHNNHNNAWWLRTPHYYDHNNQGRSSLLIDGDMTVAMVGSTESNYADVGVVPVIWLSI
ncbi:MAG: hypothetical protein IKJ19_02170 [Clostridia bacterium]|nr:hypothetical protein [Clostridia bacterium]